MFYYKISSNILNSSEYKFKPSEFLISVSNFKLNNIDLTYQEDEDLEFDKNDDEKDELIINTKN